MEEASVMMVGLDSENILRGVSESAITISGRRKKFQYGLRL